jgi:hypothetical protein
MDVGTTNGWRMDDVVPAAEMLAATSEAMGSMTRHTRAATSAAPACLRGGSRIHTSLGLAS